MEILNLNWSCVWDPHAQLWRFQRDKHSDKKTSQYMSEDYVAANLFIWAPYVGILYLANMHFYLAGIITA